ncbi:sentrin-specific protease 2 isoform X1 [Pezoporus occidentalis]|uniref:sentrin-specific protease 2 isoform X1 n=1 Tax=Pezoporus occidentalis TaxID=407982 RepID=UPI002F912C3A
MYQWLLGVLGTLFAAAARRPEPSPAPPPLRKRPPPSIWPSVEDFDEIPEKKPNSGYAISECTEKVEDVPTEVKLPAKETSACQKVSVRNAVPIKKSAEETWSASDIPAEGQTGSTPEIEMLQIDKMPCETSSCLNKKTLSFSYKTVPRFSTGRNGNGHIKPAPEGILTLRPPIKECTVPESRTSEVSKMGRLLCTAEEDVQRGEKEKYKQLLELVKEKYRGSFPDPQATSFCNIQAYSKEPVMTDSRLEEQKYRGDGYPCRTLTTSIKRADVCSSQWSQRNDMIRYYTPAENSREQGRLVKKNIGRRWYEAEYSEEVLLQLHLAPVLPRKSSALHVGEDKLPSSEKTECFSPLTEAMEREIAAALDKGEPDEIISSAFKLRVTREDIHTLSNLRWLNDEVINFYMTLLVERSKKEGYPAVHAFSTFFYPKLISGGYRAVRRWTRGVDLFKRDLILVPIHLRVHWALAVIDVRKKAIKYFDSTAQRGDKICETLFRYLQEESQEKRNLELMFSEWTLHSMESHEIPQQLNGSDCGVFMCKYADYISRDKPITFTQNDMPYFRKKMVWEIIHQQLL